MGFEPKSMTKYELSGKLLPEALLPSGSPAFKPGGVPASWVIAGSIVEVTGGSVGLAVGVAVITGGFPESFFLVAVGEVDGEGVAEGDGVAVTVGGVLVWDAVGEDVGETVWVLVGVALGSNTTSGTTAVSEPVVCGIRNESAQYIGVRISGRTGATELGSTFESKYSSEPTFDEISAKTDQFGSRRVAN